MAVQLQKQQIYLIAGIGLALVALFMIKVYLDQQKAASEQAAAQKFKALQANQTAVLVAKTDIAKGKIVDADNFTTSIVLNQNVQPGAVTSLDRIAGMTTVAPVSKGEQVTLSKFSYVSGGGDLAQVTPTGKRAITVAVDNISSLAGMIKAGDHVDVIAMIPQATIGMDGKQTSQLVTLPVFQNVQVLAVGQQTTAVPKSDIRFRGAEQKQEQSPLITLSLGPHEASLIAFIQEQGKIRLVLRSPGDTKFEPVQAASWDTLFSYVFPERNIPKPEEVHAPSDYVEIYRGMTKEKVLLAK
ncbi:MAG: Flp pilus assembly protein CpaB [Candidatus Omnitrophica bacterium]|nr:Flp pilus assembly protein CpaB [Candidatus Omnitrophota bacterium]